MEDIKLYTVDNDYIQYLRINVSEHVFANQDPVYKHTRKYLGVVLTINDYRYYAPLSSPKNSDYFVDENGKKIIRKSIIPIIRMVESDITGKKTLLGTIKLSNMIPVPQGRLVLYNPDLEEDSHYKDLVEKEIRYINRHTPEILKNATVLYKQKKGGKQINYLSSTLDFSALESAHDAFSSKAMEMFDDSDKKENIEEI